jgi:hypothetical protein
MGVPLVMAAIITYTAGTLVLIPLQAVFLAYDTVVFFRSAAKYTCKGFNYMKRYRANQRTKTLNELMTAEPGPEGEWVCLGGDTGNKKDKVVKLKFRPGTEEEKNKDAVP